ncbi:hypothetical protein [Paracoccus sp. SY]|uniref:hypothetical protein n=1 Tax=Paracoccus sp. SY TaxID=1330255 RepID=UPI0011AECD83|nr:hypothetical protein [Paracoccus sp. SY]
MQVIVHVGMHKTGSTAIQNHFATMRYDELGYCPWETPNHCGLFILLFQDEDKLAQYHGFRARGEAFICELPRLRAEWTARLEQYLTTTANKKIIFSAEDISWPGFHDATRRMIQFFSRFTDNIKIVGYVRPPHSFAVSAFQQYLKDGGLKDLAVQRLWPAYKGRFEQFDALVGAERVFLRIYERSILVNQNIISDFSSLIGLNIAPAFDSDANETLTAEAVALLFAQRHLGEGYPTGFNTAQRDNNDFIALLARIGSQRLCFAPDLWQPIEELHAEDLTWINQRLQTELQNYETSTGIEIASSDDLLLLAQQNYHLLRDAFVEHLFPVEKPSVKRMVKSLDFMRKHIPDIKAFQTV